MLLLTNIYDEGSLDIIEGEKFEAFDPLPETCIYNDLPLKNLAYSPDNDFTSRFIKNATKKFNFTVKNFESDGKLDDWMESKERYEDPAVGIVFDDKTVNN